MALLCILVLLAADVVSSNSIQSTDEVTDGTELVFAFMMLCHGHKTLNPVFFNPYMAKSDLESVMPLINQLGSDKLTDIGKRTAFNLGQFIRRRYGQLLSLHYDSSDIYIRTIDVPFAAITALIAMSAVYPANHTSWSDDVSWDPVPYSTVPVKYDYICAMYNCEPLMTSVRTMLNTTYSRMDRFAGLISNISNVMGIDIKNQSLYVYRIYLAYKFLIKLGYIKISDEILALMPGMKEASDEAIDIVIGDERHLSLEAGPLLNEFFNKANAAMSGKATPRVMVYSGQAVNVYSLMAISKAQPRQGYPNDGSLFSLELRRVVKTGKYVVLPVYLSEPGAKEIYLKIHGDHLYDFEAFKYSSQRYILSENEWRTNCSIRMD